MSLRVKKKNRNHYLIVFWTICMLENMLSILTMKYVEGKENIK